MKKRAFDPKYEAVKLLIKDGYNAFCCPVSRGTALGMALYPYLGAKEILEFAAEALEQNNFHALCAQVRSIGK